MTEQWDGSTSSGTESGDTSTAAAAKGEASNVAQTAKQSGQQVAGTAAEQGRRVADEAAQQARSLLGEARQQVSQQAGSQQQKAAEALRTVGDDLSSMADGQPVESGLGSQLVRQASDQVQQVAGWLESRDPQGVLQEVRTFAQRRPGTFLLAAGAVGLVAGRLTRAAADDKRDSGSASGSGYVPGGQDLRGPEFGSLPATEPAATGLPAAGVDPYDTWTPGTGTDTPAYDATGTPDYGTTTGTPDYGTTADPSTPTEREQWR